MSQKKILVTSALPYANGPIHIGHLVEYIQTDIWVRFKKYSGHDVLYVCADDAHGTPIMLKARQEGIAPETLIENVKAEHQKDFKHYHIQFDHYHSTHSPENEELAAYFYQKAQEEGAIFRKSIQQFYSTLDSMFLPDRFIKGSCPRCKAEDQYGDSCDKCGATYSPTDLIDPKSVLSGDTPVLKESEHIFFDLKDFEADIKTWLETGAVHAEMANKLKEWFAVGLKPWDISRDAPYFGFKIPGETDKYFYVWLDAPIGYLAATQAYLAKHAGDAKALWANEETEIHHFIGKDIMYFHTLFWPALLKVAGFQLPKAIHIHGFLTVNGQKMSKSKGTFILADSFLKAAPPDYLRYYYASKLTSKAEDLDLNLEDFVLKVNADIINKCLNIGSRTAKIVEKNFQGHLGLLDETGKTLLQNFYAVLPNVKQAYEDLEYALAMRLLMQQAQAINQYIDTFKPWDLVKQDQKAAQSVCTAALSAFFTLMGALKPVIPEISQRAFVFLNKEAKSWEDLDHSLEEQCINPFERFALRLDLKAVSKALNLDT